MGINMKNRDKWIALLFLAFIFILPAVTIASRITIRLQNPDAAEAFAESGSEPDMEEQKKETPFTKMQDSLYDFTDGLFLRKGLISLNTEVTSVLTGGSYFESTQVLLGKNHWLFYKAENDGKPIWDYMGINHFTQEELEETVENLTATRDYFEKELNIPLYFVAIPNKELVYSEEMPDTVVRLNDVSRGEQLNDYIQENTDISFLYLKPALMDAKSQRQIYYTTDTHWNQVGTFVGLQAIFQKIYGESMPPDSASFHADYTDFAGDLAVLAGVENQYDIDTLYTFVGSSADPAQYHDEVLLLLGDSFSAYLSEQAQYYYKKVYWVSAKEFRMDMIKQYEPDLIIWESAERYIDIFRDRQLYTQ